MTCAGVLDRLHRVGGARARSARPASRMISRAFVFEPIASMALGGRADEDDAGLLAGAREGGVLGQEAVAGVDRLGAGLLRPPRGSCPPSGSSPRPARGRAGRPRRRAARAGRRDRARSRPPRCATPSSSSVRMTRMAISPRLATRTLVNIGAARGYRSGHDVAAARSSARAGRGRDPALPAAAPARRHRAAPASCEEMQCGRLAVPLDRSGAVPGRVSLYVERRRGAAAAAARRHAAARRRARAAVPRRLQRPLRQPLRRVRRAHAAQRHRRLRRRAAPGAPGLLRCPALERASLIDAGRRRPPARGGWARGAASTARATRWTTSRPCARRSVWSG